MILGMRAAIQAFLKEKCSETYYHKASKTAGFPRCVFSLDLYGEDGVQRGVLSIDVYDDREETTALEQLTNDIRMAFHQKLLIAGTTRCACYYDRLLVLEDDDKDLNRRQLQFEVRVYEGR